MKEYISISPEVLQALKDNRPVVALESTIISHGMPYPQNVETAQNVEQIIRDAGAVPATIAVINGKLTVGCNANEIDRLGKKGRMGLYILTRILCLAFIGVAVYFGIHIVQTRMMFKSSILRVPGYALYSAPIFGCVFMAYEVITEAIGVFAGVLEPFYAGEKRQYPESEKGEET